MQLNSLFFDKLISFIIALIVSYIAYKLTGYRENKKKSLVYSVIHQGYEASVKRKFRYIKFILNSYNEIFIKKGLKSPYYLYLKIINNGISPITKEDIEEEITIRFYTYSFSIPIKIYKIFVFEENPNSLKINISLCNKYGENNEENDTLSIDKCLLNPGDSFILVVILDKPVEFELIESRIVGINKIMNLSELKRKRIFNSLFKLVITLSTLRLINMIPFINRYLKINDIIIKWIIYIILILDGIYLLYIFIKKLFRYKYH